MYTLIFGGLLVNASAGSASSILVYLQYTSFAHYAYEILFVNEFHSLKFQVDGRGIPQTIVDGSVFIDNFGLDYEQRGRNATILLFVFILAPIVFACWKFVTNYTKSLLR
jgi:hypothetical protein